MMQKPMTPTNPTNNAMNSAAVNRWNPRGWGAGKRAAAAGVAAVVAVGGWGLFRPELLLVDRSVNEALPAAGRIAGTAGAASLRLLGQGGFTGLGHHTEGKASAYRTADGAQILRLSEFRTSNGPDVHVYLVEGEDGADDDRIKAGGFLDLGVIKGNIGDQNYTLPAGTDLSKYRSVSIWCKRFAVNFAAAPLTPQNSAAPAAPAADRMAAASPASRPAVAAPITVTTGAFQQVAHRTVGTATITEDETGKRLLHLKGFETAAGPKLRVVLVAAQDARDSRAVAKAGYVDLGALRSIESGGDEQTYAVPADIDLWKYLAVTIWCDEFDVNFGTAPLAAPGA